MLTYGERAFDWFFFGKEFKTETLQSYGPNKLVYHSGNRTIEVAVKIDDGHFCLLNAGSWIGPSNVTIDAVRRGLADRAVSMPFYMLKKAQLNLQDLSLRHRFGVGHYSNTLLGLNGTSRTFLTMKDEFWTGIVETQDEHSNVLEAKESLLENLNLSSGVVSKRVFCEQGDWLFFKTDMKVKQKDVKKWQPLDGTNHIARDLYIEDGFTFVRGSINHKNRIKRGSQAYGTNRKRLMLDHWYQTWFQAVRKNFKNSWSNFLEEKERYID